MNISVYRALGAGLITIGVLALCIIGTIKAYNGIYERGVMAGTNAELARSRQLLLKAQDKVLAAQQQILEQSTQYAALQAKFEAMEAMSPKEVVRYVRSDPAFAASKRPADLHALRVRELQSLRAAAATHP